MKVNFRTLETWVFEGISESLGLGDWIGEKQSRLQSTERLMNLMGLGRSVVGEGLIPPLKLAQFDDADSVFFLCFLLYS